MKHILILVLFLLSGMILAIAQPQPGTGMLLDDPGYESVAMQPDYGSKNSVDTIFKVDLRPYCPTPINQGPYSTCTGWSVGYAAQTIQYAMQNDWEGEEEKITANAFSALFLYNQIKESEGCMEGTYISKALELLQTTGNISSQAFDTDDCERLPVNTELTLAERNKITDYRRLFDRNSTETFKTQAVKRSLAEGKPVVIGMQLKQNFIDLRGNEWWFPELGNSPSLAMGHAMVVVGFDDGKGNSGGAFEIMNSWGTSWGNDGFIWVNYDDFATYCKYGFQFTIETPPEKQEDLLARIKCQVPEAFGEDILFKEAQPVSKGKYYVLSRNKWSKDDIFQFQVYDVAAERFLYMFSYDPDGQITVHWPRDEKLDDQFVGHHESAVIISRNVFITLPTEESAFELEKKGLEQMCLLFSPTPIPDINARLKRLERSGEDLRGSLYREFGDEMLAPNRISYLKQSIGFWASKRYADKIVPVVIQMQVN